MTTADLDEVTAAIAAADIAWSAELGDPPSEPRYIQALAEGAMRALPNRGSVVRTDRLSDAVRLLTDIPEGTPAVLVEEAAADLVAELDRLREIERRARMFYDDPRFAGVHNTLHAILGEDKP